MAIKRAAFARATADPAPRGTSRRNTRSAYATTTEEVIEEPASEDQPPTPEEQQAPNPTPEQELQQLQAQLQNMQRERDRVAAAFATNQQAAQTLAQAAASHPTGRETKYVAFAI